jgi:hypothetical protein
MLVIGDEINMAQVNEIAQDGIKLWWIQNEIA